MPYSQASNKAVQKYSKANYDSIQFRVKKGLRDLYNQYASARGLSLSAYIQKLIEEDNK